ncbi:MAG: DEAD/DEAH box helicase [Clostridia bacterium]|nr:DEAD/DEAH box helicase [Clostridia bacterium]
MKTFFELDIKQEVKDSIADMGFTEPTPIQSEIIPHILNGKDCLAQAPTGTGKTCAFGVPIVNMADVNDPLVQAVILCPTRELAMQTETELKKLATHLTGLRILAVYGGQPIERQLAGLRKKPQIIVGTPGRVIDHLRRRTLKLHGTKMFVLDEADEMLNMGFKEDIDSILGQMPGRVQSMLFSATMPKEILEISTAYQKDPVSIKTTIEGESMPPIVQYYVKLKETTKYEALKRIIKEQDFKFVLVFTNTKHKAAELDEQLDADGFLSASLHGDLRQRVRDTVMRSYRDKKINILVATDVAARGIDVDNIEAIFNYDVPLDEEYYIHRIGRTARANRTGIAYSFVTSRDIHKLNFYEKLTGSPIKELKLEGLSEEKLNKSRRKEDTGKKFFLNVGAKDDLTEGKMIQYIISNTTIKSEDIEEVKILDIFSFVTVRKEIADELLTLSGGKFANRRLAVETSEELPRGGSGSSGPRRGGRSSERSSSQGSRNYSSSSSDRRPSQARSGAARSSEGTQRSSRSQSGDGQYSRTSRSDAPRTGEGQYSRTERKPSASRSEGEYSRPSRSDAPRTSEGQASRSSEGQASRSSEGQAPRSNRSSSYRGGEGQYSRPRSNDNQYSRAGQNQGTRTIEKPKQENADEFAPVWEQGAIDVETDRRVKPASTRNYSANSSEAPARRRTSTGTYNRDGASSGDRRPGSSSGERRPSGAGYRVANSASGERKPSSGGGYRGASNEGGERRSSSDGYRREEGTTRGYRGASSSSGESRPSTGGYRGASGEGRPSTGGYRGESSSNGERRPSTGGYRGTSGEGRPSTGGYRGASGEGRPSSDSDYRKPASTSGYHKTDSTEGGTGSSTYKGTRSAKPAYGKSKSYAGKASSGGAGSFQKFSNGTARKKSAPVTFGDKPARSYKKRED